MSKEPLPDGQNIEARLSNLKDELGGDWHYDHDADVRLLLALTPILRLVLRPCANYKPDVRIGSRSVHIRQAVAAVEFDVDQLLRDLRTRAKTMEVESSDLPLEIEVFPGGSGDREWNLLELRAFRRYSMRPREAAVRKQIETLCRGVPITG